MDLGPPVGVSVERQRRSSGDGVTSAVRALLAGGEFLPGMQIRQAEIAERLGVSRTPVREALKHLQAEGVVNHSPHVGYVLARFSEEHLSEIYLMRRLLETEVLRNVRKPSSDELSNLQQINADFAKAADTGEIGELIQRNREFHFQIFALAGMEFILKEIVRLWDASEFYRSLYAQDDRVRKRVIREHQAMIRALKVGDAETLVDVMNQHREASRVQVIELIRRLDVHRGRVDRNAFLVGTNEERIDA